MEVLDLAPIRALLPAVYDEWRSLQFDADGCVVNPLSGVADDTTRLVDGGHRRPGAVYALAGSPKPSNVKRHTGVTLVQLRDERRGQSEFAITSLDESFWRTALIAQHHAGKRLPRVTGEVTIDLTEMLRSSEQSFGGVAAWLVGGHGRIVYELDTGALEGSGGRLVDVSGRVNRFPFSVVVDVARRGATWQVDVRYSLRARGIARPVLWFGGRKIRRKVDAWFDRAWSAVAQHVDRAEAELRTLADATATAGGPAAFVRQELWTDEPDVS